MVGTCGLDSEGRRSASRNALLARYAPDLAKDPVHRWLSRYHWIPIVVVGIVLLAIGGWPCLLWGIFLRTTIGLHSTWLVNSATHMWGSRRFETRDESRNLWWVALVSAAKDGTTTITRIRLRPPRLRLVRV